ncbi:hypothetical protein [Aliidiomarina sp.]|uniref:hypothetical protein n=1 Tax=Aliidiomarina sp. TaxID=1872439 RepID=UPI003A4D4477
MRKSLLSLFLVILAIQLFSAGVSVSHATASITMEASHQQLHRDTVPHEHHGLHVEISETAEGYHHLVGEQLSASPIFIASKSDDTRVLMPKFYSPAMPLEKWNHPFLEGFRRPPKA